MKLKAILPAMSSPISAIPEHAVVKARTGRPLVFSDSERRRRILRAAEEVFTTRGYGEATMEDVARAAGMSKRTIYNFYADKRRLLAAVVIAADDFPWEVEDIPPVYDAIVELRGRLMAVIEFALSPRQIRLTRLLIAEAEHVPELADDFRGRVVARGYLYVLAVMRQLKLEAEISSIERMTEMLLGAAMGDLHLSALFGIGDGVFQARIGVRIDEALCMFGLTNK